MVIYQWSYISGHISVVFARNVGLCFIVSGSEMCFRVFLNALRTLPVLVKDNIRLTFLSLQAVKETTIQLIRWRHSLVVK